MPEENIKKNMWMVRSGEGGFLFDEFKEKSIIALGFKDVGDLSNLTTWGEIEEKVKKAYPEKSKGSIGMTSGQLQRFRMEFKIGDYVVTYNPEERRYLVGNIIGDYEYNESLTEFKNIRKVKWIGEIDRDKLSAQTKNSLGSIATIFEIWDGPKEEILNLLQGKESVQKDLEKEAEEEIIKGDIIQKAHEFIKDNLSALDWKEMQYLVAGILKGMGYKIYKISTDGADRGRDIIASPDGLGLVDPRIIVQVKQRNDQVGAPEIREFMGGLRASHKGLFVSKKGFSKEAKYEAERSNIPLTLIDLDELVKLIIQYYDKLDIETQSLIPLIKIYWPE